MVGTGKKGVTAAWGTGAAGGGTEALCVPVGDGLSLSPPAVGELEMGDWQEVWDENTGCYYYWNTQSNEVTWELPPYLATQVQGLQHYQHRWVTPPSPRWGRVGMLLFLSLPFALPLPQQHRGSCQRQLCDNC